MAVNLSDQQIAIRDAAKDGKSFDILSYAGGGKTTSQLAVAEVLIPDGTVLYLAFNNSVVRDTEPRMEKIAPGTQVSTYHALAMRGIGYKYRDRLASPWEIRRAMKVSSGKKLEQKIGHSHSEVGLYAALDTIQSFLQSADHGILPEHLPFVYSKGGSHEAHAEAVLEVAHDTWVSMMDVRSEFPISHDVYLKIWHLSEPRLPYDAILVDERQNINPVMLDIVQSQKNAQQIFSGDPYQALYGWRGAVAEKIDLKLPVMPLTASWRFGPEIARVADSVLQVLGAPFPLVGAGPHGRVVIDSEETPTAILCRSNAGVIVEAIKWMDRGKKVGIVGGGKEVGETIEGAYALYAFGKSQHPKFRYFDHWSDLVVASETKQGRELRAFVKLIRTHGEATPHLAMRLKLESVPEHDAEMIISTMHKIPGREWSAIYMSDDFMPFVDLNKKTGKREIIKEEGYVAYVGLTRGINVVQLGDFAVVLAESLALGQGTRLATLMSEPTMSPVTEQDLQQPDDIPNAPRRAIPRFSPGMGRGL